MNDSAKADSHTELDEKRLLKLLSLLGSDQDGEALNAARMAARLVKAAGLSWEDVLAGPRRRMLAQHHATNAAKAAAKDDANSAGKQKKKAAAPDDEPPQPRKAESLNDREIIDIMLQSSAVPGPVRAELKTIQGKLRGTTLPIDDRAYIRTLYKYAIIEGRSI